MLFNSIQFICFFPVVVLLYFWIPHRFCQPFLLAASYFFYMSWNPKYALLMALSTVATYLSGLALGAISGEKAPPRRRASLRKLVVFVSFFLNLSILFFFKYFNFASVNITELLSAIGITVQQPRFDVILPVGISFYTFQALSYTMDVYREELPPERNFITYALFVSFFPQLVAGPIERSTNLLPQLKEKHCFDYERLHRGFVLMLFGLFQKMVVADRIAIVVDEIYTAPGSQSGAAIAFGTLLFAMQIYCDFGGYSNIAIGAAGIMGIDLMQNFRQPYLSESVRIFWRRWHISLNTWFTDYLYIPLGGSRCSKPRKYFNTLVTFGLSGLWHGANWGFVLWGLLNGIYIIIEDALRAMRKRILLPEPGKIAVKIKNVVKIALTFLAVDFSWLFFRAQALSTAQTALLRIRDHWNFSDFLAELQGLLEGGKIFGLKLFDYYVLAAGVLVVAVVDFAGNNGVPLNKLTQAKLPLRWTVYLLGLFAILIYGVYGFGYDAASFIYFQF